MRRLGRRGTRARRGTRTRRDTHARRCTRGSVVGRSRRPVRGRCHPWNRALRLRGVRAVTCAHQSDERDTRAQHPAESKRAPGTPRKPNRTARFPAFVVVLCPRLPRSLLDDDCSGAVLFPSGVHHHVEQPCRLAAICPRSVGSRVSAREMLRAKCWSPVIACCSRSTSRSASARGVWCPAKCLLAGVCSVRRQLTQQSFLASSAHFRAAICVSR